MLIQCTVCNLKKLECKLDCYNLKDCAMISECPYNSSNLRLSALTKSQGNDERHGLRSKAVGLGVDHTTLLKRGVKTYRLTNSPENS